MKCVLNHCYEPIFNTKLIRSNICQILSHFENIFMYDLLLNWTNLSFHLKILLAYFLSRVPKCLYSINLWLRLGNSENKIRMRNIWIFLVATIVIRHNVELLTNLWSSKMEHSKQFLYFLAAILAQNY